MALPWSSYAHGSKAFTSIVTPQGTVNLPAPARTSIDSKLLEKELLVMRSQLEAFFVPFSATYGSSWWTSLFKKMPTVPGQLFTLLDVIRVAPSVGKVKSTAEGCAKAYATVAKYLKRPGLWPAAYTYASSSILTKPAGELVGSVSGGRKLSQKTAVSLSLGDFVVAQDHLVMLGVPTDATRERLFVKAGKKLQDSVYGVVKSVEPVSTVSVCSSTPSLSAAPTPALTPSDCSLITPTSSFTSTCATSEPSNHEASVPSTPDLPPLGATVVYSVASFCLN